MLWLDALLEVNLCAKCQHLYVVLGTAAFPVAAGAVCVENLHQTLFWLSSSQALKPHAQDQIKAQIVFSESDHMKDKCPVNLPARCHQRVPPAFLASSLVLYLTFQQLPHHILNPSER